MKTRYLIGIIAGTLLPIGVLAQTNNKANDIQQNLIPFVLNNPNFLNRINSHYSGELPAYKLDSIEYKTPKADLMLFPTDKDVFFYNSLGQNSLTISKTSLDGIQFEEVSGKEMTYENNRLSEILIYYLNVTNHQKYYTSKIQYWYNTDGKLDSVISNYNYDGLNDWRHGMITRYIYSPTNMVSTTFIEFIDSNNDTTRQKTEFLYTDDQLSKRGDYKFDTVSDQWKLNYETTFIYENGYLIREENAYPDLNNNLVVKNHKVYAYNTDQTVQYYYWEYYNWQDDTWVIRERSEFSYNPDLIPAATALSAQWYFDEDFERYYGIKLPTEMLSYNNYSEWPFADGGTSYYYSEFVPESKVENHSEDIMLYPNPTNGIIYLKTQGTKWTNCKVYNSMGQKVMEQNSLNTSEIDLTALKNGCYLVLLTNVEFSSTFTVLKQDN